MRLHFLLATKQRLGRVLGLPQRVARLSVGFKAALLFAIPVLIGSLIAIYGLQPSLRNVKVAMLSGAPSGHYYAIVDKLAAEVQGRQGRVMNLDSAGSVENIDRLMAATAAGCEIQFALIQDGMDWPEAKGLKLIGRLPRPESLIVLGRNADSIQSVAALAGLKLGVGPIGSGTELLARRVLAPLTGLALQISTQTIDQQLEMLARGELDIGLMVIDDDAQLISDAVQKRKLQILSIPDAASLARHLPFVQPGEILAGQYDYVNRLPPQNKQVLQVDTLVVGNGCASNGATQGLMTAISDVFPTFIRHNKSQPNFTGLPMAPIAKQFFADDGPDLIGRYMPWAIDIMPTATWIQLSVAFSILFSAMAIGHRFRLWRIDDERVRAEREIEAIFGAGVTVGDILQAAITNTHRKPQAREQLDTVIATLAALSERCRKHSMSVLVPMGQEMAYRYQETLISDLLYALRSYKQRCQKALPETRNEA